MIDLLFPDDGLETWCRAVRHAHGAGLPLVRVFEMQARSGPAHLRPAASRIADKLRDGESLEDALTAEQADLPDLFVSLASVGERTGRLPEVFEHLEEYYRLQSQMKRDFRSRIAWPVFQFVAGVFVIAGTIWLLGVLRPDDHVEPIGFGLSGTSGALLFLFVVALGVGGLLLAVKLFTSGATRRESFEAWLLGVPVVGPCCRAIALSRFCLAMKLTLDSSLSTGKALRLSLKATGNSAFESRAEAISKKVRKGTSIPEALGTIPMFPEEFRAILNVGEESGQIPEVMARQAVYYQEEATRSLRFATRVFAGLIYVCVALFLIVMILRMAMNYAGAIGG